MFVLVTEYVKQQNHVVQLSDNILQFDHVTMAME